MDVVRITELQPKTYVEQGDYIAIDNQSDGTKKVQFTNLLDDTLSAQNKAADAQATGEAISGLNTDISGLNTDINTEKLARQSTDNNLQAQIDQLVAPSGTAPNPAEIENARIGADGVTYNTLGNAIRTQLTDLKSDLNATTVCKNLCGVEAGVLYPCYVPAGTKLTMSTADGSVVPSDSGLKLRLMNKDGAQTDYWSFANNQASRTVTTSASLADTYYLCWNKTWNVPIQVEIGETATTFVEYFSPTKYVGAITGKNSEDISVLDKQWYAGEIQEIGTGFVSSSGVITSNNNYKYVKYAPQNGAEKIKVDSIYVPDASSNLATFAFYNTHGKFISAITNSEINNTSSGNTFTDVEATIPAGTSYILITFGNMSSSTIYQTIAEYGLYKPQKKERIFNQLVGSDYKQQFYLHCVTSDLGDYKSLAFNCKLHTSLPVLSYDIFFTGYAEDYTGRSFSMYKSGITKGINGNEITIAENFQNTANSIKTKYWNGVVLSLQYAQPSLTSGEKIRLINQYAVKTEYCLINDTNIELAQYPSAGFYVTSKAYNEPYNPMLGGYLCAIGDSLTAAYYKSEDETWVALISKWNNMRYDNLGISGNPIAKTASYTDGDCMAERVDDLDNMKFYTHIFVMGGANDYNYSIPIGTNTDSVITTFKGAINHIIATLTAKFPQAKIVFGTTYRRNQNYDDKPYADAMIEVCKLHSIPCLNNYENSGVQFFDSAWMRIFGATNALGNNHLNAAGDLFVATRFEHALKYGIN